MKSPIEESQEHLVLLGIIAARWATLDLVLVGVLEEAVSSNKSDMAEAIFFSATASQTRFEQVIAAVRASDWPQESKELISATIEKLRELWRRRNEILHNPIIATGAQGGLRYWLKMSKVGRKDWGEKKALALEDLQQHADRLDELGNVLHEFVWGDIIDMLERYEATNPKNVPQLKP
jgi:hypothetical protein